MQCFFGFTDDSSLPGLETRSKLSFKCWMESSLANTLLEKIPRERRRVYSSRLENDSHSSQERPINRQIQSLQAVNCLSISYLFISCIFHLEVASVSFCFLINTSQSLVYILCVFNLFFSFFNLYCWKGIHFS